MDRHIKKHRDLNRELMKLKGLVEDGLAPAEMDDKEYALFKAAVAVIQLYNLKCIKALEEADKQQ